MQHSNPFLSIIPLCCDTYPISLHYSVCIYPPSPTTLVLIDYCLGMAINPFWRYISIYISFWHSLNSTWSQYHSSTEIVLSHYQHSEPEASSWQVWQCYLSSLICVLVWSEQRTDNFYLGYKGWVSEAVGLNPDWIKRECNTPLCITTKGSDSTTKLSMLVWKLIVLRSSGMWTPFRLRLLKADRIKLHAPLKRCAMVARFQSNKKFTNNDWNGTITTEGQRNKNQNK